MMIDRRTLCGVTAFAALFPRSAFAQGTLAQLEFDPDTPLATLPPDYAGISIELSALEDPDLYSAANPGLVALFRQLSARGGVLRIGGNTSEFCWWKADDRLQGPPSRPDLPAGLAAKIVHAITPRAIVNLRAFLDATGWSCIYGLNLGTGSAAIDTPEAVFVARTLGSKLRYFQIGNEPDFYPHNGLRPPRWGFDHFLHEWLPIAQAVAEAVPGARFGGPDMGGTADWVTRFAREAVPHMPGRIVELSGHFYPEGPPTSPDATIANLLKTNDRIIKRMATMMPAARAAGLPYRMSETNSCYGGGKSGISDSFASALWGMDYMLALAVAGCAGINFHGGSGATIADGLGGHLAGTRSVRDAAVARLGSFYSPFAGNRAEGYTARPLFFGMKAADMLAGTTLVQASLDGSSLNATVYAGHGPNGWRIAIINKDLTRDIVIDLTGAPFANGELWRLIARGVQATDDIRLAHSAIAGPEATWSPRPETLRVRRGPSLLVPSASAALILAS